MHGKETLDSRSTLNTQKLGNKMDQMINETSHNYGFFITNLVEFGYYNFNGLRKRERKITEVTLNYQEKCKNINSGKGAMNVDGIITRSQTVDPGMEEMPIMMNLILLLCCQKSLHLATLWNGSMTSEITYYFNLIKKLTKLNSIYMHSSTSTLVIKKPHITLQITL